MDGQLTYPEFLVVCGDVLAAGGDIGDENITPEGMQIARLVVDGVLAAARAGGYRQAEILETLLLAGDMTPRIGSMARDACDAAGLPTLKQLFDRILPAVG